MRDSLARLRSTTVGIVGLTALWTGFQVLDESPPPILDQILVAAFGVWFATEAKRNSRVKKTASDDDTEEE